MYLMYFYIIRVVNAPNYVIIYELVSIFFFKKLNLETVAHYILIDLAETHG